MPVDAGFGDRDAAVRDAKMVDASPDATTHAALSISIEGKGRVIVHGIGSCDEAEPQDGSCMFVVPLEVPVTVEADAYNHWRFSRWTTPACARVQESTCTFTPTSAATSLGVKFRKGAE
jgi:hypothetical protein